MKIFYRISFIALAVLTAGSCMPAGAACQDVENGAREYLEQGEEAFRMGVELDSSDPEAARDYYRKAILNFEHISRDIGVRNGKLYYNIGNAYFRLGDLGRAILNYRRSAIFSANDQNLRQNLEYARSRRINRVEITEREKVFKTLFFLHYDIPARHRVVLLLVSFALSWAAACVLLYYRRGWVKTVLIVFAAFSIVFVASLTVESAAAGHRPAGVVTAEEVTARKGDAVTYQPSFTDPLYAGTEFGIIEKRTDWWQIELEDGARCWIPSAAGEEVIVW